MRALALLLLLAGCRAAPDRSDAVRALIEDGRRREAPVLELEVEVVQTELPDQDDAYRLDKGDVLDIQVEGHPEFAVRARSLQQDLLGYRVQRDGRVYLPLLGGVPARGKTPLEFQADLRGRLAPLIEKPNVAVDVLVYESQKFFVLGAVERPGVFPADGRKTLLEGVGLAGGIRDDGDVEAAYVIRGRQLLPVSLGDILLRGRTARNIRMRGGDLVYVPTSERRQVYVLGDVVQPGIVEMPRGGLNLAAAVAAAGGLDLTNADQNEIRVFRGSWQEPRTFTIGAEDVYRFGAQIRLKPGDRIHVAPRGLATWSRTLSLMLPFLQTGLSGATLAAALED